MIDSSTASTPAAARRPQQPGHRLLPLLVIAWAGVTLPGVAFAASSPSQHSHAPTHRAAGHAPAHRPAAQASAPKPAAHTARPATRTTTAKSTPPATRHATAHKAPTTKTRLAAKSSTAKRPHQSAIQPAKVAAKRTKPVA